MLSSRGSRILNARVQPRRLIKPRSQLRSMVSESSGSSGSGKKTEDEGGMLWGVGFLVAATAIPLVMLWSDIKALMTGSSSQKKSSWF